MFMATDGTNEEKDQPISSEQPCHLLEDCLFLYSTADGNPAIRDQTGSKFILVSQN